jgi:hypothetical protein
MKDWRHQQHFGQPEKVAFYAARSSATSECSPLFSSPLLALRLQKLPLVLRILQQFFGWPCGVRVGIPRLYLLAVWDA